VWLKFLARSNFVFGPSNVFRLESLVPEKFLQLLSLPFAGGNVVKLDIESTFSLSVVARFVTTIGR
jgi:hypothetical protein